MVGLRLLASSRTKLLSTGLGGFFGGVRGVINRHGNPDPGAFGPLAGGSGYALGEIISRCAGMRHATTRRIS